jgi:hypothetical protein
MLTGGCLCGAIRFQIEGELGPITCCHCSQCRRATGTAFATNANVARDAHRFTSGADLIAEYESSPGKLRAFCSRCGSPMYSRMVSEPDSLRVRLGTIDGDPGGRPVLHVWTADKAPWFSIEDGLPELPEIR